MSTKHTGNIQNAILQEEHAGLHDAKRVILVDPDTGAVTGAATSANQTLELTQLQVMNSLIPSLFDTILITYTDSTKNTVASYTFKLGAATVSTITPVFGTTTDTYTKT